jgi:urease alpha subunit
MRERRPAISIAALAALAILTACAPNGTETGDRRAPLGPTGPLDLVVSNGRIVDGSGAAPFTADVGIVGDRIVAIGDLSGRSTAHTIDAGGLVVPSTTRRQAPRSTT